MADSIQSVGSKAIEKAPQPLRRALGSLGTQFREEDGPTEAMAGGMGPNNHGMIAGVAKGSPNVVSVMQPDTFRQNAPQLVTHEGVHEWQNNLPPSIQSKIPADNAADPYNYGGTQHIQQLVHSGGSILDLPREQQAAAMQYGQAQGMPEPYKSLASTMDKVPLSTVDETDPNAKLINTHPRSPQVPPGSVPGMNFAGETYKKGQPAPGDPPPPSGATIDPAPPAGATLDEGGGGSTQAAAAPTPSLGSRMLSGVEDFGKGVAKSYGSAAANIDDLVAKHVPGGQFLTTPLVGGKTSEQARQDLHAQSTPTNTAQKVGNFAGNASQFLIPGGAEEGAVAKGAELAGDAAKFVRPVARIGATALSSGTVNRAQGGGFGAGAAAGALGAGAGEVLNAAAPAVAEKALGIRGKFDRSFNKEPGKAALEETSGIRPETVARSAGNRIGELSDQTRDLVANSPAQVSLAPARTALSDAGQKAISQNAEGTFNQVNNMENTLRQRFGTQQLIPDQVSPEDALNLRQGFNQEHMRWNPDIHEPAAAAGRQAYGALTGEIHNAVPETAALDQRVSSLIPVKNRAASTALNDSTGQKIMGRFGAHTGALTGATLGGTAGYHERGIPGAVAGGLTGLVAPELIASPEGQMMAARMMHGATSLPLARGAILNLPLHGKPDEE
jgi:outer membrane lipoprotein SlyB